jgi:hypothetical protein
LLSFNASFFIFISFLVFAICCGTSRYKVLDKPSKIMLVLLFAAFLSETTAYVSAYKWHSNLFVFNIYDLIEFLIISTYFNSSVDFFKKNNAAIYIGLLVVLGGILNILFLQNIMTLNSNFLLAESFFIIAFSLFALYRQFLYYEQLNIFHYPHFWFTIILLFYWSITFMNWGLYPVFVRFDNIMKKTYSFLWAVNLVTYLCTAFVFIFYKKNAHTT